MSDVRANFEVGIWKDFSNEHRALREAVEEALVSYNRGRRPDPIGVWGAYGAGKTQFLFWVAERAIELGLIPIYLHLNDLLEKLPEGVSPDGLREHASMFVRQALEDLRTKGESESLLRLYRDAALLRFVVERTRGHTLEQYDRPVILVDEVEQAYKSLCERVRADDRSPLRAWLEEGSFKVCAFAVGSLYAIGRADRERLHPLLSIPAVRPSYAKGILSELPEAVVNSLWWLSRGKPRHLMKAARRYGALKPQSAIEVREFVRDLDSVSQAPYEAGSQYAVPAIYAEEFSDELVDLLSIRPIRGSGDGRIFQLNQEFERELTAVLRDAFKIEGVALDLVRYICMLLEAVSCEGRFALTEADTKYLLRLGVDFLLEYERERLEKESMEGDAALRKLLEIHDAAEQRAAQIFWRLEGKVGAKEAGTPSVRFELLASAFPLPTTSPTLLGTHPSNVRAKYENARQPVFSWKSSTGDSVVFVTSLAALSSYAESSEFRERALAPRTGIIVLLPYDAEEWRPSGLFEWLVNNDRLHVLRLTLALTEFLLSLRDYSGEGNDPMPIAERAESQQNLRRQVGFYSSRLRSFVEDVLCRPRQVLPIEVPRRFSDSVTRVADKKILTLAARQAFEALPPTVLGFLVNLRDLVLDTRAVWGRSGHISLADDLLPHRSSRNERPEQSRIVEDLKSAFGSYLEALYQVATFVGSEDVERLSEDPAGKIALRAVWEAKRGTDEDQAELRRQLAQLSDIASTLKSAGEFETRITAAGVTVDMGPAGTLLEALQDLEQITLDTDALLKTREGADRRLAAALFQEFLAAFLECTMSDVAKTKAVVRRAREALDGVGEAKERITEAAGSASGRFANISADELQPLLDDLWKEAIARVSAQSSLADVAGVLENVRQDYQEIEGLLARLSTAFEGVKVNCGELVRCS